MFIIPLTPMNFPKHKSLGANTEAWESFAIRPINDKFQLFLFKVIQHDFEKDSTFERYYPVATLKLLSNVSIYFKRSHWQWRTVIKCSVSAIILSKTL